VRYFGLLIVLSVMLLSCPPSSPLSTTMPAASISPAPTPYPGSTWTSRAVSGTDDWLSVAFGNGVFVAVPFWADAGTFNVLGRNTLTSTDGRTWTLHSDALPAARNWSSVTYGAEAGFVAVASDYGYAASSPDGVTWTESNALPIGISNPEGWVSIAYGTYHGTGTYFAVAWDERNAAISTAGSGIAWTTTMLPVGGNYRAAAIGNDIIAVMGFNSASVYSSLNGGSSWTGYTLSSPGYWFSMAYGNGRFVAIDGNGRQTATSPDGISWTVHETALPDLSGPFWTSVAFGNGVFVAVAGEGNSTAATSTDGIAWTARSLPQAGSWNCAAFGNGVFAALAGDPLAASSP
jgi:hypothetical protein